MFTEKPIDVIISFQYFVLDGGNELFNRALFLSNIVFYIEVQDVSVAFQF